MQCPNCGFDSQSGMRFCGRCGARLGRVCETCNFVNPLDYAFCGMCGVRLVKESDTVGTIQMPLPLAPASPPALDRLAGQLEGERRIATVILADVHNSTSLMERVGTETWVQIMNRVFQILETEIYRFGGQVDQFRGDGLVAFFGAASAHEDDPERAVLAAMSMQQALKPYAGGLADRQDLDLKLRVGVNTGQVIVASVGDARQHREDTAMGEAVTIASRMETAAEPGTVLVSENTFALVEANFDWQPLGEIAVKGVSQPIVVYRPLRPHSADHELQSRRILMPLTGRDAEFQTLKGRIEALCSGRGGIVFLTGEKGMGKSPMVNRVREHVRVAATCEDKAGPDTAPRAPSHPAVTWLFSNCRSYDQSTPYSMWLGVLRDWLGAQPLGPSSAESSQDLSARLCDQTEVMWGEQFDQYYPYLATLLSLPVEGALSERVKYLNAEGLHKQFSRAMYDWVEALAQRKPLVLTFNDMQWADASSLELLKHCLPLCDSAPVLWLATLRPDRASPAWELYHHIETEYPHRLTAIKLLPLSDLESREQIEQMLGRAALAAETVALVVQKAQGNPYYIHEIVYALITQGVLEQAPTGTWRQTRPVTSLDLPGSLQSLLVARIDQLKPEEKRVLQMAAVIGPLFWRNVLEALVEDTAQLQVCLTGLQRSQLVQEHNLVTDLGMEYSFNPSLVRDVVYEGLLSAQRVAYHLQVAERIEEIVSPECRQPYHSLLAYHYRHAGKPNKELYHALGAAEDARKVYANSEALGHYSRAVELLNELERDARDESQRRSIHALRFEALNGRREVQYPVGNIEAGHVDSRALLPLAKAMADDPAFMIDALLAQPEVTDPKTREELSAGLAMAQQAMALAQHLGDKRREMLGLVSVSGASFMLKDPTWQELGEQALALTRQLGDLRMEANLLLGIGDAYGMDDLKRSTEYLEAALAICQQLDDKATESSLLAAISPQFERSGDYYRQLTDYEQKRVHINRELGNRMGEGHALMFCGQIQAIYLGDYEGGLALMQQAKARWEDTADKLFPLLRIAQIQAMQGKFEEAQATLEQARPLGERVILDIGHAGLWLVSAILDNAWGDEAHLREALAMTAKIEQMVADNLVSQQYHMAAACESAAAHIGLAGCLTDEAKRQVHLRQALESSRAALDIYHQFGFTQIVECVGEEILYRHSLTLQANGLPSEANDYLKRAHDEMMRKHNLIPAGKPDSQKPFRQTFLDNIGLHRKIRASYEARFSL